ncbi:MAG: hypothetical protein J5I98_16850 [Phaeodactylibacter sp.]|nr:hypothetical protein [Phaeodactylibacter sp.]
MAKKREPVDPFGLSLLDVLSNALGGVILLMLIVAVTLKGNDKKRLNLPQESLQGKNYTKTTFNKKEKPEVEINILLAQIQLIGNKGALKLESDVPNCVLSQSTSADTMRNDWLVVRHGIVKGEWSVVLNEPAHIGPRDSVAVFITLAELAKCSEVAELKNLNQPVLRVVENGSNDPDIYIAGIQCRLD